MFSNVGAMIFQVIWIFHLVILSHGYSFYNCCGCLSFSSSSLGLSLSNVKSILIDERNNKIYVAARNLLLKLNPSFSNNKSAYEYLELPPSKEQYQSCISTYSKKKEYCSNYMRLLVFDNDDKVFACGTYATKPRCWRIQRTGKLQTWSVLKDSYTRSPGFPDQNVSGVISDHPVKNGYLFTGFNNNDAGTKNSAIFKEAVNTSLDRSYLRTFAEDIFLQDANFVSSYLASDNFVYFYWREKAKESPHKGVYSRVGRVCSYDKGGALKLTASYFTSFTKSRLSCSVPGNENFEYNYLQSTFKYMKGSSEFIYGIFTLPESGLVGSAVCVYSFNDIQTTFSTSKYLKEVQTDNIKTWKVVAPPSSGDIPGNPKCNSSLNTKAYSPEALTFAKSHPLLADNVEPMNGKPLLIMPNIRFTKIAVDSVKTTIDGKDQVIPVMFLATDNGTIYKVAEGLTPDKKTRIIEQINVLKGSKPIQSLQLFKDSLYVGCESAITKVPTHRCGSHKTCRSCVALQDPYCGWSLNKCTAKDSADSNSWIQDVLNGQYNSVCPEEPPNCSLHLSSNNPGATTLLDCTIQGIPVPIATKWQLNSEEITTGPEYTIQDFKHSQRLSVHNFGLKNLGEYGCTVQNNKGESHTCKLSIKGTLPVVSSGFFKMTGFTYFWCEAEGIPEPTVRRYKVIGGLVKLNSKPVNEDYGTRSYYCIAQNKFGPSVGQNFTLKEKTITVKMELSEKDWDKKLEDTESSNYKVLSDQVKSAVASVYSNNTRFMAVTKVTFSKGSVIARVELRFVCQLSETNAFLLTDLQKAILKGKVGSLQVEKTTIIKSPYEEVPSPDYRKQAQGMDTGLFVVALLIAVVLSLILGFLLGIKFHWQFIASCGPKKPDTTIYQDPDVQSVKYTTSPCMERNCTDGLLERNDGDGISVTGSTGGHCIDIELQATPDNKPLANGKTPKTC